MNRSPTSMLLPSLAALLCLLVPGCDARPPQGGHSSAPASAPQRIASLTLATDELLADLVPSERVVCVTYLVDDAEISNAAGAFPASIPRLRDSDLERILALSPDLVCVAPYNSADFLRLIERSGIQIYRNEAIDTMDEIEAGIRALGARLGEPARASSLADSMRNRRRKLAARLENVRRRPRVLYWSAGFTSGRKSTLDDIIREAGGVNVAAELGMDGPCPIAPEQVILADPEFVLLSRWSADARENEIENHPLLRELRAVRERRCVVIAGRQLSSVSHHVVAGAEGLARQLHPQRFADQDAPASGERR